MVGKKLTNEMGAKSFQDPTNEKWYLSSLYIQEFFILNACEAGKFENLG